MDETLVILIVTALACSIIGIFLVLKNLAMVSDAISHAVLLGIVIAYFITRDVTSPFLVFGAGIFGVLTVFCIDVLLKSKLVKEDAATGIIFSLFFSIAVIIISKYARNVHIDIDTVFMGEIIYAPLNTMNIFGFEISKSLFYLGIMLILNSLFIVLFYKELKISIFDAGHAMMSGFSLSFLYYGLMTLVSTTAVSAFDAVGAILVVSFLIAPASSAYLISKKLNILIALTVVYALFNSIIGYKLAILFNVNISGMCASVAGITFLITLLFNKNGVISSIVNKRRMRFEFESQLLMFHLQNHNGNNMENGYATIYDHINWNRDRLDKHINFLIRQGYVIKDDNEKMYRLTKEGYKENERIRGLYEVNL